METDPLVCDICNPAARGDREGFFSRVGVWGCQGESCSGGGGEVYSFLREGDELLVGIEHHPAIKDLLACVRGNVSTT